jgi:heat shock protein HslJ
MKTARSLVTIAFALAACGSPTSGGTSGGDGSSSVPEGFEHAWRLTEGRGPDGAIELFENYDFTLVIEDGAAGGQACNHYGGDVEIDGSSYRSNGASMTDMACMEPGVMEAEAAYMAAYSAVESIRRDGDDLVLEGPDVFLRYEYVAPPPTADLVDTEWQLQSLLEGRGPEGTASSAHPATLLLTSDGEISGTTGCRSFDGKWVENGGEIAVPEMAMHGECSEELAEQDSFVVGVIGDGFKVEIEGQSLTVWDERGDLGLQYTTGY